MKLSFERKLILWALLSFLGGIAAYYDAYQASVSDHGFMSGPAAILELVASLFSSESRITFHVSFMMLLGTVLFLGTIPLIAYARAIRSGRAVEP